MKPRGMLVIKDKENAITQIETLCKRYDSKNAENNLLRKCYIALEQYLIESLIPYLLIAPM